MVRCACGASADHSCGGAIGATARATGFAPFMHTAGAFRWVCPKCLPHITEALQVLHDHFGAEAYQISFIGALHNLNKTVKR